MLTRMLHPLIARARRPKQTHILLGETGISLPIERAPATAWTSWLQNETLPATARRILKQGFHLSELVDLICCIPGDHENTPDHTCLWMLCNSNHGLVSIVARNAATATINQLQADTAFALSQAARYGGHDAAILVQAENTDDDRTGFIELSRRLNLNGNGPDTLYCRAPASPSKNGTLACAWISPYSITLMPT